jgi:hypothetical protein
MWKYLEPKLVKNYHSESSMEVLMDIVGLKEVTIHEKM